jgi:hypothetical protein
MCTYLEDILLSKAIQKASESSVVMFLAQPQKYEILERFWAMFLAIYAAEQGNIVFNNEKVMRLFGIHNNGTNKNGTIEQDDKNGTIFSFRSQLPYGIFR